MRDLAFGFAGLSVGGVIGVVGTLAVEAIVVVAAAGFVLARSPEAPAALDVAPPVAVSASVEAPAARKAPAGAPGEVQLLTVAMVRPMLDGSPMVWDGATGAWFAPASPGDHRLQLLEPLGTGVKAETVVRVQAHTRSQLRYAKGQLTDNGTMPLASTSGAGATVVVNQDAPVLVAPPPAVVLTSSVSTSNTGEAVTVSAGPSSVTVSGDDAGLSIQAGRASLQTGLGTIELKVPKVLGGRR